MAATGTPRARRVRGDGRLRTDRRRADAAQPPAACRTGTMCGRAAPVPACCRGRPDVLPRAARHVAEGGPTCCRGRPDVTPGGVAGHGACPPGRLSVRRAQAPRSRRGCPAALLGGRGSPCLRQAFQSAVLPGRRASVRGCLVSVRSRLHRQPHALTERVRVGVGLLPSAFSLPARLCHVPAVCVSGPCVLASVVWRRHPSIRGRRSTQPPHALRPDVYSNVGRVARVRAEPAVVPGDHCMPCLAMCPVVQCSPGPSAFCGPLAGGQVACAPRPCVLEVLASRSRTDRNCGRSACPPVCVGVPCARVPTVCPWPNAFCVRSVGGPGDRVPGAACTRTLGQLIAYGPDLRSCRMPSACGAGPCVRPPTRQPGRLAFRALSAGGRAAIGGRSRRLRTASPRVHTRGGGMAGRTGADGTARRTDVSRQSAGVPLHARRLRRACAGRYKPYAVRPGCEDTWGTRCSLVPVRLPGRRWRGDARPPRSLGRRAECPLHASGCGVASSWRPTEAVRVRAEALPGTSRMRSGGGVCLMGVTVWSTCPQYEDAPCTGRMPPDGPCPARDGLRLNLPGQQEYATWPACMRSLAERALAAPRTLWRRSPCAVPLRHQ